MSLTESQLRAATTLDRPVAVTAGPGSGKTRVLVARYLGILESGNGDIENIVAITFTKKAASEMRDRVRKELEKRAAAAEDSKSRTMWRDRRRKLDAAIITTIHGFCSRLLREHPVEAGIDPQFTTLDTYEESVLVDAAAHAAVTGAIDDGSAAVAELVASYSRPGLVRAIEGVQKSIRSLGLPLDELIATSERNLGTVDEWNACVARVDETVLEALATLATLPEKPKASLNSKINAAKQLQAFATAWARLLKHLEQVGSGEADSEFFELLRRLRPVLPKRSITTRLKPYAEDLHDLVGKTGLDGALGGAALDLVARVYLPAISELVRMMGDLYALEKRNRSALDYEDLQLGALRLLTEHPEVARRARARYRYFLVDEYQDTNGLQRDIVKAFVEGDRPANLFIVGDPKQSIYGFRGAEVAVFAETSREIVGGGGDSIALETNFRSDGRIVRFVRDLFDEIMRAPASVPEDELESLGYVIHEAGVANHVPGDDDPVVEFVFAGDFKSGDDTAVEDELVDDVLDDESDEEDVGRDLEARLLAERIRELVKSGEPIIRVKSPGADDEARRACGYGDVALLLRTRSHVKVYERALRLARVPFYVIAGKGFYDRPETRDLLELLRFLDNTTDDIALAAALRSPLFGVSDETLLGLRSDRLAVMQSTGRKPRSIEDGSLWMAVVEHRRFGLVSDDQSAVLDRAVEVLGSLRGLRNQVSISGLLRETIRRTQFDAVLAAADDGAQRLSNVDKLVSVARSFERGRGRLLGDFTEYVREFNRLESDEAEASVRADAEAVAVMTVHKSKGLEFPVVAIADLQGIFRNGGGDVLVDREGGLGFQVPDGTARRLPTRLHRRLADRTRNRERFEAMRTLFVAATRAEDRLILSAASKDVTLDEAGAPVIDLKRDALGERSWLSWLLRAIAESGGRFDLENDQIRFGDSRIRLIRRRIVAGVARAADETADSGCEDAPDATGGHPVDVGAVTDRVERLLRHLEPAPVPASTRFAVTSLLGFETCPRRFLLGRLLRVPDLAAFERLRDVSERPEPGSHIEASLRGLVAHRFCETLLLGEHIDDRLQQAVADVRRDRGEAYADMFARYGDAEIAADVRRLAEHYSRSGLRQRIDGMLRVKPDELTVAAGTTAGSGFVVSEMGFSLRFPDGSIVGAVDKLLLEPDGAGGWRAEVIDFKTNRLAAGAERVGALARLELAYRLQMQAYALAVWRLVPNVTTVSAKLVTLSGGPDVEIALDAAYVEAQAAESAVRDVLGRIRRAGAEPANFPPIPGPHCRSCVHVAVCPEGSIAIG
ncbi:MAG: UvrD-helicase domain-containing protein [Blastocatellia bacterium]|nr:UvrD-helicase domain-containing protein [Blastocatellia bacterium]